MDYVGLLADIKKVAHEENIPIQTIRVEWETGHFKFIYVIPDVADTILVKHDIDYPNGVYALPKELSHLKKLLPHLQFK